MITRAADNGAPFVGVLGTHRSGISATAPLLGFVASGFEAPDRSTSMTPGLGDDECQSPVVALNDSILEALGGNAWDPPAMPRGWETARALDPLRERAAELISERARSGTPVVVGDPRLSLTFPLWRDLAPEGVYVVCLRNPLEAVGDLVRGQPETLTWDAAANLWLRYAARALEHTQREKREILFYEDYLVDPMSQLTRLMRLLGGRLRAEPGSLREQVEQLLDGEASGQPASALEVAEAGELSAEVGGLFVAVRAARALSATNGDREHGIDATLAKALERFAPDLAGIASDRRQAAAAREDAAAARQERDAARRAERAYRADLDRVRAELEAAIQMQAAPLREAEERIRIATERFEKRERMLKRELRQERKKLQSLESSVSWRITRPLRVGKMALAARRRTNGAAADAKSRGPDD